MQPTSICAHFDRLDGDRASRFSDAQEAARLTVPYLMPRTGHNRSHNNTPDERHEPARQSLGAELVNNGAASVLAQVLPAQVPFFTYELFEDAQARVAAQGQSDVMRDFLRGRRSVVLRLIESGPLSRKNNRRIQSLRTKAHFHFLNLWVIGSACAREYGDGNVTSYPFENWVCERDGCGDVLTIIARERIDVLELEESQLAKLPADKLADARNKSAHDRLADVYIRATWNPEKDNWLIEEEVWDTIVASRDEAKCELHVDAVNLRPGDSYGISPTMLYINDLAAYDELYTRLMDHAAIASDVRFAVDRHSNADEQRLSRERTRTITREFEVRGGQVQDAAILAPSNVASFEVSYKALKELEEKLRRQFGQLTGMVRDSDRTTALEVARVTLAEAERASGPMLVALGEGYLTFLVERYELLAEKLKLTDKLNREQRNVFRVAILTGAASLAKQQKAVSNAQFMAMVQQLPPPDNFPKEINRRALIADLASSQNVDEHIINTEEEQRRNEQNERQARVREDAAMQMNQAMGGAVESAFTTALTSQPR